MKSSNSYRNIFKATTLFGGVQVYQILISVVRSKFIAVLLGTAGVGLLGLYQSTLQLVQSITSLGLSQSAVRDISEAHGTGDDETIGKTVSAYRKIIWFTGLLGMIAVMFLSPILSKTTFGNYDYTVPLIILSCILLIDQISSGQKVVLQGMRRLKELARASAIGATLGLFISIPIYYAFGIKGIVPTLILNSISGLIIAWLFTRKIPIQKRRLSVKETWDQGKIMVRMGIVMSLSGLFASAINYIIRTFIMRTGGTELVGLYQAGFIIINTYVGMVFSAVGTDYYPRLAAVNQDNDKCRSVVCQQGEIATQILAPLLCVCILLMPIILKLLYSDQFLDAGPFILWCCPGMMFKLVSWLIAYQFIAKAESKLFIFTEIIGGLIYLPLSLIGYRIGGLTGLGIAFSIDYIIYLIIVFMIAIKRYRFSLSKDFIKSFFIHLILVTGSLSVIVWTNSSYKYWICSLLTVFSCIYALYMLDKKMGIIEIIKERIHKQ